MKRLLLPWSVLAIARTVCLATAVADEANRVQPGHYCYEWSQPEKTKVEKTGSFQRAGGVEEFTVPFAESAVLYIAAKKNDNLSLICGVNAAEPGEALYNGIVLPSLWPPQPATWPHPEPVAPPYLVSPPSVISIDVGRQLFVDNFLIEETTLQRTFHLAEYYHSNPVLQPDQPWESKDGLAEAMAFSDGVWFDPKDNLFKVWYVSGKESCTCYATSTDGIHWDKPALDVEPPSNIVLRQARDSATVWLDLDEKNPQRRFKMVLFAMDGVERNKPLELRHSPDGIHWSPVIAGNGYPDRSITMDRTTVFYNPFRGRWVLSLRDWDEGPQRTARCRYYVETPDLEPLDTLWQDKSTLSKWASADRLDQLPGTSFAQLYNLDAVAYESLLLGAFSINTANADSQTGRPKINQVKLGYSRDGFHWHRPDRRVFLPVSETTNAWNWGNVQSVGGVCLVVGERLYFYVSGRTGRTNTVGLAFLRRDGFASMDAGAQEGTLTTRPVCFSGKHLFVNVDDPTGELRVEILSLAGQVVAPFNSGTCVPVTADQTSHMVLWKGVNDLSSLVNQPVRFRFHLKNGRLYAFWVSLEPSGASRGYVAAGGPGFSSNRDLGSVAGRN